VPLEFEPRSVALAPRGGMWLQIVKRSYKWHLHKKWHYCKSLKEVDSTRSEEDVPSLFVQMDNIHVNLLSLGKWLWQWWVWRWI
jgi:hypothetical protein